MYAMNNSPNPNSSQQVSRDFKGIWIPREIWLHPFLSMQAKCLWAEIQSLHDREKGGCFASNEYLCGFIGLKLSRFKEVMKELRESGLIEDVSFDGRRRIIRAVMPNPTYEDEEVGGTSASRGPENRPSSGRKTGHPSYIENKDELKEKKSRNPSVAPVSDLAVEYASLLFEKIQERDPKFKPPNLVEWAKTIDRMHRLDNVPYEEIRELILFAQDHDFWHKNVLCPGSLRKQRTKLVLEKKDLEKKSAPEIKQDLIDKNKAIAEEVKNNLSETEGDTFGIIRIWPEQVEVHIGNSWLRLAYFENGFEQQLENMIRKAGYAWKPLK